MWQQNQPPHSGWYWNIESDFTYFSKKLKSIVSSSCMMDQTSSSAESFVLSVYFRWKVNDFTHWQSNVAGFGNETVVQPLCLRTESKEWWYSHFPIEHMLSLCPLKAMILPLSVCMFTGGYWFNSAVIVKFDRVWQSSTEMTNFGQCLENANR